MFLKILALPRLYSIALMISYRFYNSSLLCFAVCTALPLLYRTDCKALSLLYYTGGTGLPLRYHTGCTTLAYYSIQVVQHCRHYIIQAVQHCPYYSIQAVKHCPYYKRLLYNTTLTISYRLYINALTIQAYSNAHYYSTQVIIGPIYIYSRILLMTQ